MLVAASFDQKCPHYAPGLGLGPGHDYARNDGPTVCDAETTVAWVLDGALARLGDH